MRNFFHHLFLPRHTNNFRARILHASALSVLALVLFTSSISIQYLKQNHAQVLGISYSINTEELLRETNRQRVENGLPELSLNDQLMQAAQGKASHMMTNHYWAHFAPDGTTPWQFIKNAGYNYTYAGENLAKGFTESDSVVTAWMNSPSHRENILSQKYNEIGFAILEGNLDGEDTVLVVQMFGSRNDVVISKPAEPEVQIQKTEKLAAVPETSEKVLKEQVVSNPIIDSKTATKSIGIFLVLFLAAILLLDLLIVERKKIPRIAGHNLDHIILLILFGLFMILESSSGIL